MTDRKKINTVLICVIMWVAVLLLVAVGFYASLRLCYRPSEVFDADDIIGKTRQEIIDRYGNPDIEEYREYDKEYDKEYENTIAYREDTDRFLRLYEAHEYYFVIEFDRNGKAFRVYEDYLLLSGA